MFRLDKQYNRSPFRVGFSVCASQRAYSICLSDLSVLSDLCENSHSFWGLLFDAERSRDLSASEREALRTTPVSPLAWHVVFGETQSRGTNMAEYKKGEYDVIKHLKYNNISIYLFC